MPRREEYEDNMSVESLERFLTDPATIKVALQLASIYQRALHPDDETVEDLEFPELGRNDRLILIKSIYELLAELMGDPGDAEDDELDEDEYASANLGGLGIEVAKDKKMSVYYKAFMGKMRDLVGPWHGDKNRWLEKWVAMGLDLYSKSPAADPKTAFTLVIKKVEDTDKDSSEDSSEDSQEEAAVIDSGAALPTRVMREITNMGFIPLSDPEDGDAAWVKNGAADGYPDRQVVLVRREDESYLVIYSINNKYDAYGKVQKRRTLDDGATAETILRSVAYMYDSMIEQ